MIIQDQIIYLGIVFILNLKILDIRPKGVFFGIPTGKTKFQFDQPSICAPDTRRAIIQKSYECNYMVRTRLLKLLNDWLFFVSVILKIREKIPGEFLGTEALIALIPPCSTGMANLRAIPTTPLLSKGSSKHRLHSSQFSPHSSMSTKQATISKHRIHCLESTKECEVVARGRRALVCWSAAKEVSLLGEGGSRRCGVGQGHDGYLVREFGWGVRRMVEVGEEMRRVAYVQAEAFHVPVALFNDFFFKFFEVRTPLLITLHGSMHATSLVHVIFFLGRISFLSCPLLLLESYLLCMATYSAYIIFFLPEWC